jgi:4-hydroxy-3-methylbut-2-enyl diphosphate reductase
MIVIGGKKSSNTRKLYEICKRECPETYLIQTFADLNLIPLAKADSIGITAGASTPNTIIEEVLHNV